MVARLLAAVFVALAGGATVAMVLAARADAEAREAKREKDSVEAMLYASQLQRAKRLWDDGRAKAAKEVLNDCQVSRRGWEHRFLHMLFDHLGQRTFLGHTSFVNSVVFSLDGKRLASGSFDKTVKVWNPDNGQELLTLKGHTGEVWSVAFSPDGMRLVA